MILIVLAVVLTLAIAFFQVVQGILSALIMTILSVLCALVAFNYYEPLAQVIRGWGMAPVYIHPVSLMAIFFISLLALRIVFDRLLLGNMAFGTWSDRIGGGVLGIITGMILVGMLAIALQMLPWDASILGYKPYDDSLQPAKSLAPFNSDRFVLGMVDFLSGPTGSMSAGDKRFSQVHPDYLLTLQADRNRCELAGRCDSNGDDLDPKGTEIYSVTPDDKGDLPPWLADNSRPGTNAENAEGDKDLTYIVRVTVSAKAKDQDNWFRLPATHFRLVTESNGGCHFYYPVAFLTFSRKPPKDEKFDWKAIFGERSPDAKGPNIGGLAIERNVPDALTIDWVYKVPAGQTPQTIVFRGMSKVQLPAATPVNPSNGYAPYDDAKGPFQDKALKRNARR
jgi:uncharacterized membrane protein required for colicin V production